MTKRIQTNKGMSIVDTQCRRALTTLVRKGAIEDWGWRKNKMYVDFDDKVMFYLIPNLRNDKNAEKEIGSFPL